MKNSLTWLIFELEKMIFFFKWVRTSAKMNWYHYQGAKEACKYYISTLGGRSKGNAYFAYVVRGWEV